jgi:hypothetical protein
MIIFPKEKRRGDGRGGKGKKGEEGTGKERREPPPPPPKRLRPLVAYSLKKLVHT